jgi:hypothetical protein
VSADGTSGLSSRPELPPVGNIASEVGAIVAHHVRREIEAAETTASELERRARDRAAADRAEVHRLAAQALARVDMAQDRVARLLSQVREEVARIVEDVDRAQAPPAPVDPPQEAEPPPAAPPSSVRDEREPAVTPAVRHRRARFGRRRGTPPLCDVCGRVAEADEGLEGWQRVGRMSVCPACQAEGWALSDHGTVPYRVAQDSHPT